MDKELEINKGELTIKCLTAPFPAERLMAMALKELIEEKVVKS